MLQDVAAAGLVHLVGVEEGAIDVELGDEADAYRVRSRRNFPAASM